ncbi:hypothetical protein GOZ78_03590 [Agrobacterium vitis]|uniref:hypothetical protein n=1 Tax=Agrobacterium vitis TaxID=373 RepID=UPI0012E6F75D|nr:hypothetical protein [Agrobacterium vitis]MVA09102.1 hypothetical protein [Agrobacterium vitis]
MIERDDDDEQINCPICDDLLQIGDVCATDIELGTCHAACLKGSPVVDLETGDEVGGQMTTFRYGGV